jgi:hypothetical protein
MRKKNYYFAIIALFAPLTTINAQSVEEWKAKAIQLYPELAQKGSNLNQLFIEKAEVLQKTNPKFFTNPAWPVQLANSLQLEISDGKIALPPKLPAPLPGTGASTPSGQPITQNSGDLSSQLQKICTAILRAKLSNGRLLDKENEWFGSNGKIKAARKPEALKLLELEYPEIREATTLFLKNILQNPGRNGQEDKEWLSAFLWAPKLHAWASNIEPLKAELYIKLMGKLEDPTAILELFAATSDKDHFEGRLASIPLPIRQQIWEKAMNTEQDFNGIKIPKENLFGVAITQKWFDLILKYPVSEWGELVYKRTKAPTVQFEKNNSQWYNYLENLKKLDESVRAKKKLESLAKENAPELLEELLITFLGKNPNNKEIPIQIEALHSAWNNIQDPSAKESQRIFPALLNYYKTKA